MAKAGLLKLLIVLEPSERRTPILTERALLEMVGELDERWELHMLQAAKLRYKRLPCRYQVHLVPFGSRPKSVIFKLMYILSSIFVGVRVVKKYGIHLTFCKGGHLYLGLSAFLIGRLTGRSCLLRVNEDTVLSLMVFLRRKGLPHALVSLIGKIARLLEQELLTRATFITTHGPTHYARIRRWTEKVAFIPLGVDFNLFKMMPERDVKKARAELLGDPAKRVVLFVGRIHPMKDLPTLLKAFKSLSEEVGDVVLLIIGGGVEEATCKALAEELRITDKTLFLGVLPNEQLPIYYNMADVYVLPSLYEEWSNTIMEAMACGVPVVATDVGGNPCLIRDGETGFLVPPKRPDLLAEKIRIILENEELARRMGEKAREEIKKYDRRASVKAYKEIMLKLIMAHKSSL